MEIDGSILINFFNALADQDDEANEIKHDIREQLKSKAEELELDTKAVSSAFNLFKKYRSGKHTEQECTDYNDLAAIIENHFTFEN